MRSLSITVFVSLIVGFVFLFTTPTHAATCTDTYLSGSTPLTGYGASYNVFSTAKELLVKTTSCTDTTLSIKAGNDQTTTLVYKEGYHWSGTGWIKYSLTSPDPLQYTYYYPKAATASVPIPTGNTSKYYVAYLCQNVNESWKCGCSNTTCATRAWQLQQVNKTVDSTSGPVCGNNICEAGETTASCAQDCPASTGGARGRVHVAHGTVLTDKNTLLRGVTMGVTGGAGITADANYWKSLHDMGANVVRFDVKTVQAGKTPEQQLPIIDRAVDLAGQNHMYIMLMNSVAPGSYNLQGLKSFWSLVAPRYKNRTHVLYEMTNEPVGWYPRNYTAQNIADLKSVYDIMRSAAPDTHIVLFSFANMVPDSPASTVAKIATMGNIDWTKASVGFHHYVDKTNAVEQTIIEVRRHYPLFMTETNYWVNDAASHATNVNTLRLEEKLGISWVSLDGKGSANHFKNEIVPNLRAAGYTWAIEN